MSELKVIAITKKKDYYRIGESFNYSGWYATKEVADVEVATGDVVEITHEKEGKEVVLKSIKVVGKASQSVSTPSTSTSTSSYNKNDKGTDINNAIRKQTVAKCVPETLKAMDMTGLGIVDVIPMIKELYETYDELTK